MRTIRVRLLSLAALAVVTTVPSSTQAEIPGPHPAYVQCLSDLRAARAFLSQGFHWGAVKREDKEAIQQIDAAIAEIKKASFWDGKSLKDHPPVDTKLSGKDRFVKANELLTAAHHDLDHAEDMPPARGLRDKAVGDIDAANLIVEQAIHTKHW